MAATAPLAADFTTLIPQLVEMGQTTTARLLSFSYGPAPEAVATAMALPDGARVQTAVRVRLVDGRPFSHLTTYVPEAIARTIPRPIWPRRRCFACWNARACRSMRRISR